MGTREIMFAAVIPAAVSTIVLVIVHLLIARREKSRASPGPAAAWLVPILLAGGVVLGSWAWQTRVELWPDSATHRFPAVALTALLAGLLGTLTPLRRSPVLLALPAFAGGGLVAWAFLGTLHPNFISETARWGWIAGVAAIAAIQAWAIETGAEALPGWRMPGVLWLLAGVAALGATAGLANAPLVLWPVAAVCFGAAVAGLIRRERNLLRGVGPALAIYYSGTVAFSNWFGDHEQWLMFALLAAAPIPLALAGFPALRGKNPLVRLLVAAVPAFAMSGVQAAIAVPELIEATGGGDEYEYDL